ncbi:hypothetical protein ACTQ3U_00765 [Oscillospiraceae bacterium LCP25S3_F9]
MEEANQMIMQMERQAAVEINKAKEKLKKAVNPMTYLRYYDNYNRIKGKILEIKKWLNNPNSNANTAQQNLDDIKFKFTGKHTDIANISGFENGRMSVSELDNIADNNIKNAVKQEFSIAEKQGYIKQVNVDNNQFFELTPKGKEHINSAEFVKQFEHNQIDTVVKSNPRAVVNFQGNADDMNIFRYTDKVNISNSSAKVQNYFQRCSPKFVSIKNGIAQPTDILKNMLAKSPTDKLVQNGNIKMVTGDNAEKLMQAPKTAAKEGAKTAAKEGAKTAAKVAAQKGATVAAGTAAGAATAGVGTVVVVVAEKAAELAKKIEEAKNKVKNDLKQTTQQIMK